MEYQEENYREQVGTEVNAYAVDLDGTLASSGKFDPSIPYPIGPPIDEMVEAVQRAHLSQKTIVVWTARPWSHLPKIRRWLADFNVPYDSILCGKPLAYLVDDRGIAPEEFVRLSKTPNGLRG